MVVDAPILEPATGESTVVASMAKQGLTPQKRAADAANDSAAGNANETAPILGQAPEPDKAGGTPGKPASTPGKHFETVAKEETPSKAARLGGGTPRAPAPTLAEPPSTDAPSAAIAADLAAINALTGEVGAAAATAAQEDVGSAEAPQSADPIPIAVHARTDVAAAGDALVADSICGAETAIAEAVEAPAKMADAAQAADTTAAPAAEVQEATGAADEAAAAPAVVPS